MAEITSTGLTFQQVQKQGKVKQEEKKHLSGLALLQVGKDQQKKLVEGIGKTLKKQAIKDKKNML